MPYPSPWSDFAAGVGNVGNSMSNVAVAQAMGKQRQMQMLLEAAREQAYLQLAAERNQQEGQRTAADIIEKKAQTAKLNQDVALNQRAADIAKQAGIAARAPYNPQYSGAPTPMPLAQNLQGMAPLSAIAPDSFVPQPATPAPYISIANEQGLNRGDLIQALTESAASAPATAGQMLRPIQQTPGRPIINPVTGEVISQAQISPDQQMRLNMAMAHYQALQELGMQRFEEYARHNKAMEAKPKSKPLTPAEQKVQDAVDQVDTIKPPAPPAEQPGIFRGLLNRVLGTGQPVVTNTTPVMDAKTPTISTQEQYDALPSGSVYVDTDGLTKRKK